MLPLLRGSLLSACIFAAVVTQAESLPQCHSVSFKVAIEAYDESEQPFGGNLLFRVRSGSEPGWFFDIVPADATANDYIYPVNLPLRFNANQYVGSAVYGDSVKSSLSHPHEMRFLLDRTDFDHVSSLIGNVLWPYQTADPDKALSNYKDAVKTAKKGWLAVAVSSYSTDAKTGDVTRMKLRVKVTTPMAFEFHPGLKSMPVPCPSEAN